MTFSKRQNYSDRINRWLPGVKGEGKLGLQSDSTGSFERWCDILYPDGGSGYININMW